MSKVSLNYHREVRRNMTFLLREYYARSGPDSVRTGAAVIGRETTSGFLFKEEVHHGKGNGRG
jgi:hypothetical protein